MPQLDFFIFPMQAISIFVFIPVCVFFLKNIVLTLVFFLRHDYRMIPNFLKKYLENNILKNTCNMFINKHISTVFFTFVIIFLLPCIARWIHAENPLAMLVLLYSIWAGFVYRVVYFIDFLKSFLLDSTWVPTRTKGILVSFFWNLPKYVLYFLLGVLLFFVIIYSLLGVAILLDKLGITVMNKVYCQEETPNFFSRWWRTLLVSSVSVLGSYLLYKYMHTEEVLPYLYLGMSWSSAEDVTVLKKYIATLSLILPDHYGLRAHPDNNLELVKKIHVSLVAGNFPTVSTYLKKNAPLLDSFNGHWMNLIIDLHVSNTPSWEVAYKKSHFIGGYVEWVQAATRALEDNSVVDTFNPLHLPIVTDRDPGTYLQKPNFTVGILNRLKYSQAYNMERDFIYDALTKRALSIKKQ